MKLCANTKLLKDYDFHSKIVPKQLTKTVINSIIWVGINILFHFISNVTDTFSPWPLNYHSTFSMDAFCRGQITFLHVKESSRIISS